MVKVTAGRLTDVVVSGPHGPVAGTLSVDGLVWTAESGVLDYNAKYAVTATAVDRSGLPTALSETIATVAPTNFLSFTVSPGPADVVGVGMPHASTSTTRSATRPSALLWSGASR